MKRKIKKHRKSSKYTAGHVYFSLLIGFAVIAFWRGAWGLMDLYLLPNNQTLSFTLSLIIGLAILLITHYIIKELMGD
jgi:uncharacterized membrane protein YcjF (UPF0283 family)